LKSITRVLGLLFVLAAWFLPTTAPLAADAMGDMTFINPDDIKWGSAPPVLPQRCQDCRPDGAIRSSPGPMWSV